MLAQDGIAAAFASLTLNSAQRNYAITGRECLAVIWALEKFRPCFNQLPVKIITGHRALEYFPFGKNLLARMIWWTLRINEFNIQIEHRPASTNMVADFLSGAPRPEVEN